MGGYHDRERVQGSGESHAVAHGTSLHGTSTERMSGGGAAYGKDMRRYGTDMERIWDGQRYPYRQNWHFEKVAQVCSGGQKG